MIVVQLKLSLILLHSLLQKVKERFCCFEASSETLWGADEHKVLNTARREGLMISETSCWLRSGPSDGTPQVSHAQSRAGGYQRELDCRYPSGWKRLVKERDGGLSPFSQAFSRAARLRFKALQEKNMQTFLLQGIGSSSLPEQAALCEQRAHSAEPPQHRSLGHGRAW